MRQITCLVALLSFLFVADPAHSAGKIVVNHDEWTFLDFGLTAAPDGGTFALNVASWFTGGRPGNFLAYSANAGVTEPMIAAVMTNGGHGWTVSTAVPFTLATLQSYDGVFVMGTPADNQVLIDYVEAGGNVYLAGGTAFFSAADEAALWSPFLNHFGLGFEPSYNGYCGSFSVASSHPVLLGVDYLYYCHGNTVTRLDPADTHTAIVHSYTGDGLLAVFEGQCVDADVDGICDSTDLCPGTVIPESASTVRLGVNRWALVDVDEVFDTRLPRGRGPSRSYTLQQTGGCSCEQIILNLGLGAGHAKFGCSTSAMDDWTAGIAPSN